MVARPPGLQRASDDERHRAPLGKPAATFWRPRAQIAAGSSIIAGFNIGPGNNKTILVRAAGPALSAFGVGGAMDDPRIELFFGSTKIAENDNWPATVGGATPVTAATFSSVGAFAFAAGSRDAALLATLAPGSYTAVISGVGNASGVVLLEVYEMATSTARLTNISARARVGTGANILIPGIVVSPGGGTRRLLVRAAGPSLGALGVADALANPILTVLDASGAVVASNDNWESQAGAALTNVTTLSELGAACAIALVLYLTWHRSRRPFALPLVLLGGVVATHLAFWIIGISPEQARLTGWTFQPPPASTFMLPWHADELTRYPWSALPDLLGNLDEAGYFIA